MVAAGVQLGRVGRLFRLRGIFDILRGAGSGQSINRGYAFSAISAGDDSAEHRLSPRKIDGSAGRRNRVCVNCQRVARELEAGSHSGLLAFSRLLFRTQVVDVQRHGLEMRHVVESKTAAEPAVAALGAASASKWFMRFPIVRGVVDN